MRRQIECEACGFEGTLTYKEGEFTKADITYCPACSGDISEVYNIADEDATEEDD